MWDVVVIGGGITGLATAYELRKLAAADGRELRVGVVEGAPRLGGKIVTEADGGFLLEGGPDSFLVHKPWALELVRELGLEARLVAADAEPRTTYVVHRGRLVALPMGMQLLVPRQWGSLLRSPLLSWGAKLHLLLERWRPPRRCDDDESVADFVRRRLGSEVLERVAEPLLAHIHVADVERMSLRATYAPLAELEERYGSLTRGVQALRRRVPASAPLFLALRGGMGELIAELAGRLPPESLRLGRPARALEALPGGWAVHLDGGDALTTTAIVLAVPAFAAGDLLEPYDAALAQRLRAIRYVSLATLSLGYRRAEVGHPLAGYGFFVPRGEKRTVLAATWTSSKFAGRVPDGGHVLMRLFLGGALGEEVLAEDDATLAARARDDVRDLLGIRAAPVLERLYRWPRGYPQYEVGHGERVRAIETALPPGLAVAGSAYHGVGLPDCIRSAREAARASFAALGARRSEVDGGVLAC